MATGHIRQMFVFVIPCIFLLLTDATNIRDRRDKVNYIIETLVVVDDIVFNRWMSSEPSTKSPEQQRADATAEIKKYISLVIQQTNDRLKTLESADWTIQMSVTKLLIIPDPLSGVHQFGDIDLISSSIALTTLRLWTLSRNDTASYDHVLLLTGRKLVSSTEKAFSNVIKGRAYVSEMCSTNGYSVSLVEEIGGFQSAGYIAHEIAHSLGAEHDGEGTSTDCAITDRYIMASDNSATITQSNVMNPWYFSTCTTRSISNFLSTEKASCLTVNQPIVPDLTIPQEALPGLEYAANEQCQMIYDKSSQICLGGSFGKLDQVCTAMYCLDTSQTQSIRCVEFQAVEGTPCADGKMCRRGICISDNRAPDKVGNSDSECPFGDSVVLVSGSRCSEYVPSQPNGCYNDDIRSLCCESCNEVKKESQVCPYGDRKSGCSKEFCRTIRPDGSRYDEDCCDTCSYDTPLECVDVEFIGGMSCARFTQSGGLQRCYNASVAFACCHTCAEQRKGAEGCEYGDTTTGNLCASLTSNGDDCSTHAAQCCQTCCKDCNDGNHSTVTIATNFNYVLVTIITLWINYFAFNGVQQY